MARKIRNTGRIFFLLFFTVYALTPIQIYAVAGGNSWITGKHSASDIVWANMLFSSPDDPDENGKAPRREVRPLSDTHQSCDMVLIKKRRGLVREQFAARPIPRTMTFSRSGFELPFVRSLDHEIAIDPLLRERIGWLSLHTGLSPPSPHMAT